MFERGNKFGNAVADVIIQEAINRNCHPKEILNLVAIAIQNKCRCVDAADVQYRQDGLSVLVGYDVVKTLAEQFAPRVPAKLNCPEPKSIIYSGDRTIVLWADGSKTIVKCSEDQPFDEYTGFVAALAKRMFGATHKVKKLIDKIKCAPNTSKKVKGKNSTDNTDRNI